MFYFESPYFNETDTSIVYDLVLGQFLLIRICHNDQALCTGCRRCKANSKCRGQQMSRKLCPMLSLDCSEEGGFGQSPTYSLRECNSIRKASSVSHTIFQSFFIRIPYHFSVFLLGLLVSFEHNKNNILCSSCKKVFSLDSTLRYKQTTQTNKRQIMLKCFGAAFWVLGAKGMNIKHRWSCG